MQNLNSKRKKWNNQWLRKITWILNDTVSVYKTLRSTLCFPDGKQPGFEESGQGGVEQEQGQSLHGGDDVCHRVFAEVQQRPVHVFRRSEH